MERYIITGVSRGIGFELIQSLAKKGKEVIGLSRNLSTLESIKDHSNVHLISYDLSDNKGKDELINLLKKGGQKTTGLIHNAGLLINKPFEELSIEDFEKVYSVNVFGLAKLTQLCLPFLSPKSHVVSISSMGGIQGSLKFPGLAAYSSSKGALITLSELLAEEYKDKQIAFNCVALGAVQTEMLEEAFPGYKAPISASEMADYLEEFTNTGHQIFNGKIIQASSSTP